MTRLKDSGMNLTYIMHRISCVEMEDIMKVHFRSKANSPASLKKRLVHLILVCWVVPVIVIFTFLIVSYRGSIITKLESLLMEDMRNHAVVTGVKLDEAIAAAKKVSYDQTLEEVWRRFGFEERFRAKLYEDVTGELKSQFYTDRRFDMFAFYLVGEPLPLSYSSKSGHSYTDFVMEDAPFLTPLFTEDTPDATVKIVNGRLYIIRNLYTVANYTKFGSLVTELNIDELWKEQDWGLDYNLYYCIDSPENFLTLQDFEAQSSREEQLRSRLLSDYSGWETDVYRRKEEGNYLGYLYEYRCRDYHLGVVMISDKNILFEELVQLYRLIALLFIILLPIIFFAVYFVNKQVSHPISLLTEFSRQLEQGGIGITMQKEMPNREFAYLRDTYNHMSKEVKESFDYAYDEQLARKDAKIQALQAQINPHFLNNTLEMMNWQARMAGDTTVSKMIEALSTVLDYSMDREDRRLIPLSEELRCADAYYYIISMRFGQRVQIEKEIDHSLLQFQVPQLILQPLLENAVVHGVEAVKNAVIKLRIFHDEQCIYLQIRNTGRPLTEEDQKRIERLLSGRPDGVQQGKGKHTSLGIRNINERVKLIYGEKFGLRIYGEENGVTVSTICLPYQTVEAQSQENTEAGSADC